MKKEDILKFYQTYRLYIFPVLISLSSLFLIVFIIYPQTAKLIDNQKAVEALSTRSKILETKAIALESVDSEDLSQKVGYALAALPPEKDYGNALGLLQQLVTQSGFSIASISFSSIGSKAGSLDGLEAKLEIKGVRTVFQSLLNNLENSPRLVRINSIDISSSQASQALDASLSLQILYSQLPQDFGSEDSPLPQISQKDEELLVALAKGNVINTGSAETGGVSSPRGKANPFE